MATTAMHSRLATNVTGSCARLEMCPRLSTAQTLFLELEKPAGRRNICNYPKNLMFEVRELLACMVHAVEVFSRQRDLGDERDVALPLDVEPTAPFQLVKDLLVKNHSLVLKMHRMMDSIERAPNDVYLTEWEGREITFFLEYLIHKYNALGSH